MGTSPWRTTLVCSLAAHFIRPVASLTRTPRANNMMFSELPDGFGEVDVIVIGGGTAGLVVASRLSDSLPQSSILVVEAGRDNYQVPTVIHPALYRANADPAVHNVIPYVSSPEKQLGNRSIALGGGGILGGGSSVNGAIYARAQETDYDAWDTPGWSTSELLPFLKRFETYFPTTTSDSHGDNGPIQVSDGTYSYPPLRDDFIRAVNQTGYSVIDDLQDLESDDAVSAAYRYVSPDNGTRQDTAHTYLHPRLRDDAHQNLHVLLQTQVIRVIIDENKRATGVEIRSNPAFGNSTSQSSSQFITARKLVVLSAGALATPQILERSGVGDGQVLEQANVTVVSELPGVGMNYQDHHLVTVSYRSNITVEQSVDSVINGALNLTELLDTDAKILSWNGIDASSKLRPSDEEISHFNVQLRKVWDEHYASNPNKPLGSLVLIAGILGDPSVYGFESQHVSIGCYNPYPLSRGYAHITGSGIDDPLDFKTGFLSDPEASDVQTLVWLYKKQRQVAQIMTFAQDQASPAPRFPNGSPAAQPSQPESYTAEDDEAIEQWAIETIESAYHPMGTCKMAPVEMMGVVDNKLNVHGITGLKVADMSIAPENVSANLMSTALLIGEKAAAIIIEELDR